MSVGSGPTCIGAESKSQNRIASCALLLSLIKGGVLFRASVMTPPPFGSPATSPSEALRLCVPASRRVCLYRDAGAPALNYLQVADPCLEGGQVAILRPHVASSCHVTKAAYSCLRGVYVRWGTKYVRAPRKRRTSENAQKAKFAEFPFHALR
jgi:hypothetical protein